jgi:hypothetical protein
MADTTAANANFRWMLISSPVVDPAAQNQSSELSRFRFTGGKPTD